MDGKIMKRAARFAGRANIILVFLSRRRSVVAHSARTSFLWVTAGRCCHFDCVVWCCEIIIKCLLESAVGKLALVALPYI